MPAYTIGQLRNILGDYAPPGGGDFTALMRQVLPRMNAMGLWRDSAYEISLSGALGYISLPADTESVLACTINDRPRATRSLWHDVRITGRTTTLSPYYGIVDAGYFPVLLDMTDVQEEDEATPVTALEAYISGTTTAAPVSGPIAITGLSEDGARVVLVASNSGDLTFTASPGIVKITDITYDEVTEAIDLVDPDFPTKIIATIPAGSGVVGFRRFRISSVDTATTVHLLVKRGIPSELNDSTVIHLGNISALKHAMLGCISEDGTDVERAEYHWQKCGKLLDEELLSIFGSAKPTLTLDLSGGRSSVPIHNLR